MIAILFYYPKENRYGINILTAAIEDINDVNIFFIRDKNSFILKIQELLTKNYEKILIGFSFFTTQIWDIKNFTKKLKEIFNKNNNGKIIFIAGGPHSSGMPEYTLSMGFDFVFVGESENSFREFIHHLLNNQDIKNIKGIVYKKNTEYFYTGKAKRVNSLDNFPSFSKKYKKFNPIEITRGCNYYCHFCQTPYLFGGRLRHRSIDNILNHVEYLHKNGLNDIRFITPDAFSYEADGNEINIYKIESLLKGVRNIIKSKGKIFFGTFPSEVRPEKVNDDTIYLIKKYTDNKTLIIGLQTGSERLLKKLHRGHTVSDVYKAVDICVKNKIIPVVDVIFGFPDEDEKDIKDTKKVIEDLIKKGGQIHAHIFLPLPGTPLFKKVKKINISTDILNMLEKLASKRVVSGNWKNQLFLAERIIKEFL